VAQLQLLLLVELFCMLLKFLALRAVAPIVVYWAPQIALVITEGMPRPFVAMWTTTPTSRCSSSTVVGAPANGLLLLPSIFFFLFLPLL
jgi:hypothetical protein